MTWCDTLLEAAIRWWEHCSHKWTTSCAHDYNQKPYSGKALASTQYSLAMNQPNACQENINNTIMPHHRGFNDWLFELPLRSYQIEAVWPLFSDLRHQQGIFAQTAAHWLSYIQACHSKFLKSLKHTHTLTLTLNFCRSFWSCLKCLNALSSLQLYWQTKIFALPSSWTGAVSVHYNRAARWKGVCRVLLTITENPQKGLFARIHGASYSGALLHGSECRLKKVICH